MPEEAIKNIQELPQKQGIGLDFKVQYLNAVDDKLNQQYAEIKSLSFSPLKIVLPNSKLHEDQCVQVKNTGIKADS